MINNINKLKDRYANTFITSIRNKDTESEVLKKALYSLGEFFGQKIINELFIEDKQITTPMNQLFDGSYVIEKNTVVISTLDDYRFFAKGISDEFKNVIMAYIDFEGKRGRAALSMPLRSIMMPDLTPGQIVDTLIVAKSVLATGCTAITLAKKAIERYNPSQVIVASVFYTEKGISELMREIRKVQLFVYGEPDIINDKGMLLPGVGDLDLRLKDA